MRLRVIQWLLVAACNGGALAAQSASTRGPDRGSLVLQGGVGKNHAIDSAFVALAGGSGPHVVIIPTASIADPLPPGMEASLARHMSAVFHVRTVTVLQAVERATSDSDSLVERLRTASGVWILGGFPERLVHAYLGTKAERAITEPLDRGGVVGGESAGAMIQGSWLERPTVNSHPTFGL